MIETRNSPYHMCTRPRGLRVYRVHTYDMICRTILVDHGVRGTTLNVGYDSTYVRRDFDDVRRGYFVCSGECAQFGMASTPF